MGSSWVSIEHTAGKNTNLTKNLPPHHKMSVPLELQRMRKQKEKKPQMCRSMWELLNPIVTSGLILWDQEKTTWLSLGTWQRTFKVTKMLLCILTRTFRVLYSLHSYEHPGSMRSQSYKLLAWNPWKSTLFYHFNCHTHNWSTCWRQHSTISYSGTQDLFVQCNRGATGPT